MFEINYLFNLFYILLLTQAVLASTIVILILMDIKNAINSILSLSNSIERVAAKAESVVETAQRRVDQLFTLKSAFDFVKSFFSDNNHSESESDNPESNPRREKRRVKII